MGDSEAIATAVANALEAGEVISDECARVIASQWYAGQASAGYEFVSTGTISDPVAVWRELFTVNGVSVATGEDDERAARSLGTYLKRYGPRGPVAGWPRLWL